MHWLTSASARAGLPTAADLTLRPSAPLAEAWEAVARVSGVTPEELARMVAPGLRLQPANLDGADRRSLRLVPERVARRYGVVPLRDDDRSVVIATANPMDLDAEQALEFAAGRRVVFELAAPDAIARALNAGYAPALAVETVLSALDSSSADLVRVVEEAEPELVSAVDVESEPIVRLVSVILRDAIVQDASDIHIEPGAGGGTIRFRVDGLMRIYLRLPMTVVTRVVSRIKVLSRLNITDRLRPQDGRARISVDGRDFDLRVSTVPTRDSEKAVIRILRSQAERSLDTIGIPASEIARFRQLLGHRDGIVTITGPTGSGKTTTIYAAIREIAARAVNLVTVEDPVEYSMPGITQIQADPKRGVTFASALRSILRQDPDVIFVGEIRDLETAQIAVQAAMTGHLVLATVHANDAVGAVARLRDLGLDMASIGATLRGSIAQRLVRRLCPECATDVGQTLTAEESRLSGQFGVRPARRAAGCPACGGSGYRGRVPVAEVAIFTPPLAEQIIAGASPATLHRAAVAAGMRPLHQNGLTRVVSGETSIEEVERVLGDTDAAPPESPPTDRPARPAVLLVEDDPVERRLARAVLDDAGFDVVETSDGHAAVAALGRRSFALIITDLLMEGMDGAALVRTVRDEIADSLPIIVLTGADDHATEMELLDAGADDYLRKPIHPTRFLARVKAALRRNAPTSTPETARGS